MQPIMRAAARALLVPAAVAGMWLAAPERALAQDNTGCAAANGLTASFVVNGGFTLTSPAGGFIAGQVITVTFNLNNDGLPVPVPYQITGPDGSASLSFPPQGTTTVVTITNNANQTGIIQVQRGAINGAPSGTVTISCLVPGSSGGTAAFQNAINAQVAISNGKMVLQQTSDAIKLGVLQSFAAGTAPKTAHVGTEDRIEKLTQEQADLARELDELSPAEADRRRDLARKLALSRSNLAFARDEMRSMKVRAGADQADTDRPGDDRERKPSDPAASMHINAASLADSCTVDCDPTNTRWNAWIDGRLIGATDSAAQQSTFGFVGVGGVDYKLQPWLAVGVTLGTETFTDKLGTSGIRVAQNGFSVAPYVGVRLDSNVFLAGFAGFSHLNYNNTPLPAVSAQFEAWRFIAGGSLTGVWRYGPWRLQPSIDIGYGSENQASYTDSAGTAVPGQIVQYGRVWGGPEVGYRIEVPEHSWSIEPFVLARANLDFASNNNQVVVGQGTLLRGQGSGGAGIGMQILGDGFNVRLDVTYDSIGVSGLDIWTGRLRGGWSF